MILFSIYGIDNDPSTLHIAYMEKGKEVLTVDFYSWFYGRWEESAMSGNFTPSGLLRWIERNYPYHEIFHIETP